MKVVRRRLRSEINIHGIRGLVRNSEKLSAVKTKFFCVFLTVQRTVNNFFYTFYTKKGKILATVSAGMSGFEGAQTLSVLSGEVAGKMVL